ncbi:MAG: hypothetical protein ABIJ18_03670 [archaeon]
MRLPTNIRCLKLSIRKKNYQVVPRVYAIPSSAIPTNIYSKVEGPVEVYVVTKVTNGDIYGNPIVRGTQEYDKIARWVGFPNSTNQIDRGRTIFISEKPSAIIKREELSDLF